jgi:hypothetical protein
MQQLSSKGMRIKEVGDIPVEKPRMISQMAELIYGIPINYKKLASDVNLPVQLVKETLEAHAMKPLETVKNKENRPATSNVVDFRRKNA